MPVFSPQALYNVSHLISRRMGSEEAEAAEVADQQGREEPRGHERREHGEDGKQHQQTDDRLADSAAADTDVIEELLVEAERSLHSCSVEIGLRVAQLLLEEEVTQICGPRYQRDVTRQQHHRRGDGQRT